jgi:hypothetical protein
MAEAVHTLRRLPEKRVQGYFSSWPPIVRDYWESFGWSETRVRLGPPSAAAIDRMDRALEWLAWLDADDAKLVWERASNTPWKEICWRLGVGRTTAWERWIAVLCVIAARLNGETLPFGASRRRALAKSLRRAANGHGRARV